MNNIFKIPAFQRRKAIPKQIKDLELLPLNEQFSKLTMSIVGDDDFRPVMTGNFFAMESKKIVSTDAHKLTAINMPKDTFNFIAQKYNKELDKEPKGLIFHTLSQLQKDYNKLMKNNNITISFDEFINDRAIEDGRYPNYEAVIPKEFTNEIYVDYSKLYWYAKVLLDAKVIDDVTKINTSNANEYQNKKIEYLKDSYVPFLPYTKQIILTYTLDGKQEYIGFNARLVCDLLKFAMELNGKTFGLVGLSGNSRAMVIELENGLNVATDSIGIVMPVFLQSGEFDNTIGDSDFNNNVAMYYDLDTNSIISDKVNYPINESIGFMPNKANLSTPNIRVKEEVSKVENSSADLIDKKIRGLRIALKVAKQGTEQGDEKLIEKKIKGLEIAKRMKNDDLPFAKGGGVKTPLTMINEFKRNGLLVVSSIDGSKGIIIRESDKNSYNESDYTKSYVVKTNDGEKEIMARYLEVIDSYKNGGAVDEKLSYKEFSETLRDNDKINAYTGKTTTGMEMFYLPTGHSYLGKKFTHKNKQKAYKEYLSTLMMANGGGVGMNKSYNNPENATHVLHIDNQNWYLEKIDSTHFYMSNDPNFRGMAHHIGQHNGEIYYDEVKQWLKDTQYAKGGAVMPDGKFKLRGFPPIDKVELRGLYDDFKENFSSKIERFTKHLNKVHNSKLRLIDIKELMDYAKMNFVSKGGMVEYHDYKGVEIMYEPTYEEYFVNDLVFNTLEKAHKYIDSGEANEPSTYIQNLYRRGAMAKGGGIADDNKNKLWYEVLQKFFKIFYGEYEDDTAEKYIKDSQVTTDQAKYYYENFMDKYKTERTLSDGFKIFKQSLTKEELDSIQISFNSEDYADAEEHDTQKRYSTITIKKKENFKKGGSVKNGYMVFNYTDNLYATNEVFQTKNDAKRFIDEFKKRFVLQGYYRDSNMNKIDINDVDLYVLDADFNPYKFSEGGSVDEDISWDITIRDEYDNETFEINVRGYFENEEDAIKQAIKDYDIYVDESDYGKMYWNGNEITIYGAKKNYKKGGKVKRDTLNVLNELYDLKNEGVTEVQLNGFYESIGYVIGLQLNDTEIKKVGNNAYITLYENGGSVEIERISMSRLLSEFKNEKEIFDGQIVNRGVNQFKIENDIFYIKKPNENWEVFRKIKYEDGGSVDGGDYVREDLNFYDNGGSVDERNKEGMIYALQEFISAGTIANKTDYLNYDKIAEIRSKAIQYYEKNGDKQYSLGELENVLSIVSNPINDKYAKGGIIKINDNITIKDNKVMVNGNNGFVNSGTINEWFENSPKVVKEVLNDKDENGEILFTRIAESDNFIYYTMDIKDFNTPNYKLDSIENDYPLIQYEAVHKPSGRSDYWGHWNGWGFMPLQDEFKYGKLNYQHPSLKRLMQQDSYYKSRKKLATGGSLDEQTYIDLFEDYENIPAEVQMILDEYSESFEDGDYIGMSKAQNELEQIGYTFDFYVDGDAYGLRPINVKLSQIQGYEDEDEE